MATMLTRHNSRDLLLRVALWAGALGVLATGADHLEEYTANQFSSVPTIGTLFLLNFLASLVIAAGLVVPARHLGGTRLRMVSAIAGIGLAGTSLIGLWISETWGLFGFMDHGTRPAILAAIAAEGFTVLVLGLYAWLARGHAGRGAGPHRPPWPAYPPRQLPSPRA
jgi:hypothetical protein